jgi:hypothetical protein
MHLPKFYVRYECDTNGELSGEDPRIFYGDLSGLAVPVDIEIFTWQDNLRGWPTGVVPTPVTYRVLHIVLFGKVTWRKPKSNFKAGYSVQISKGNKVASFSSPSGSTGPHIAQFGPMIVELVQPVSSTDGVAIKALFDVESANLSREAGEAFERP